MSRNAWIFPSALVVILIVGFSIFSAYNPGSVDSDAAPEAESDPPKERSRIRIPRPPAAPSPPPAVEEPEVTPITQVAEASDDTDDAPDTDDSDAAYIPILEGGSDELQVALQSAMSEVTPRMIDCLAGWHDAQPDVFVGTAVFSLHIDDEGLEELEILDVESVPEATLSCLGDVMWDDVGWPAADEATDVTWPVQLSVREDGG